MQCPADMAPAGGGDGVVDADDLQRVFAGWNNCCKGDANYRGGPVNVDDVLTVLSAWGPCPSEPPPLVCTADITHDGGVDVDDLLMVINACGPCPKP